MRIIEWNCQGGFRLKNKEILELNPDILIIPECENQEKLQFGKLTPEPNDFIWYSDTGKKGIGIFSYSKYKFKLLKEFNPHYRYIIPLEVSDGKTIFLLFAIWAMDNKENPLARYIGQVWLALEYYKETLKNNSILIGDFNSNQIWDEKERVGNHSDVVNFLKEMEIESLYHKQYDELHGKESNNTFYMYRNLEKSYHIDYVFASNNIIKNGYKLSIENPNKWIDKSDHVPIITDINEIISQINIEHSFKRVASIHLNTLSDKTKEKYQNEIKTIQQLAEKLDHQNEYENNSILISKLEILKQIDLLANKLNN